ncbi:farnesol dehydrogenase-like [Neodiprion virginianus]|uniref:farnesol dehydrogenase-like n=1 Tax=Neodiprion virginianus TaxID=2961670 RepID=UPI001EE7806B|nr:farnesol dehydrogenase-like [Neodiprion virginianus]
MDRWVGKVAVVTGASSGIGAAIVEGLVEAGVQVVGLARRLEKLEALAASLEGTPGKLYPRKCDVRKEEELLDAFKWVKAELGGVDILVNNAGIANSKQIIDDNVDSFRGILEVNVLAMAIAIREAVASMKSRDVEGYIVNINSTRGHPISPNPNFPTSMYIPSKYAVTALTATVRQELAADPNNKIKITSISPGFTKTDIVHASNVPNADNFFESVPHLDSKDIANATLYVLGTRNVVQVTELTVRPTGQLLD